MRVLQLTVLVAAVLVASCAPAAPTPSSPAGPASQASQASSPRVLTASIPIEPTYIAALAPLPPGGASDFYQRMFNAFLDLYDDQARPVPYLAEALPQLYTDSWILSP